MDPELKAKLIALELTEDQVKKLEDDGAKSEADIGLLDASDLKNITGCGTTVAKRIVQAFAPKPAASTGVTTPATPAMPPAMNITVATGNPDDMTVQQLVEAVSKGERSRDFTAALRRKTGGTKMHVFVRVPGGDELDVTNTMELIAQDYQPGEEPKFWNSVPTETLTEVLMIRRFADPLTGEVLEKGDPWEKLGEEAMAMAAYSRLKGVIMGPVDKYTITSEATQEPSHPRWVRIRALWTRGVRSNDPLVLEARAAIIYTRGSRREDDDDSFRRARPSKETEPASGPDGKFKPY